MKTLPSIHEPKDACCLKALKLTEKLHVGVVVTTLAEEDETLGDLGKEDVRVDVVGQYFVAMYVQVVLYLIPDLVTVMTDDCILSAVSKSNIRPLVQARPLQSSSQQVLTLTLSTKMPYIAAELGFGNLDELFSKIGSLSRNQIFSFSLSRSWFSACKSDDDDGCQVELRPKNRKRCH